jgi:hypothetical protein
MRDISCSLIPCFGNALSLRYSWRDCISCDIFLLLLARLQLYCSHFRAFSDRSAWAVSVKRKLTIQPANQERKQKSDTTLSVSGKTIFRFSVVTKILGHAPTLLSPLCRKYNLLSQCPRLAFSPVVFSTSLSARTTNIFYLLLLCIYSQACSSLFPVGITSPAACSRCRPNSLAGSFPFVSYLFSFTGSWNAVSYALVVLVSRAPNYVLIHLVVSYASPLSCSTVMLQRDTNVWY